MEKQHQIRLALSDRCPDRFAEEVARNQRIDMQFKEPVPGPIVAHFRIRLARFGIDLLFTQDPTDGSFTNLTAQLKQFADDPQITPAHILLGKPDNGFPNFPSDRPRATDTTNLTALPLLLQPTLVGAVLDNVDQILNVMTQFVADAQQPRSLLG